jgi:hypothetical protein
MLVAPDIRRRLVLAQPDVNRMSQEVVGRPGQVCDLGNKLWLDQCTRERTSGGPERRALLTRYHESEM